MTIEEAVKLFDAALKQSVEACDAVPNAIRQIRLGGFSVEDLRLTLFLLPLRTEPQQEVQSDADFLRELRIAPDLTPDAAPVFQQPVARPENNYGWTLLALAVVISLIALVVLSLLSGGA